MGMTGLTAMQVYQGSVQLYRCGQCLIVGEPTSGRLVLWTCDVDCEGLPTSGQVVHWTRYQGRQGCTYLGKKLLGCRVEWQAAVGRVEAAMVRLGGGVSWVEWVWTVMTGWDAVGDGLGW